MNVTEIKSKKVYGDFVTVGSVIGKTPTNVRNILDRPNSKDHVRVIELLEKLITTREQLHCV